MDKIIYSEELGVYIDLTKIVEITKLEYLPTLQPGIYQTIEGDMRLIKANHYYFTICYQLKKNEIHYFKANNKKEADTIYQKLIKDWKNSKL